MHVWAGVNTFQLHTSDSLPGTNQQFKTDFSHSMLLCQVLRNYKVQMLRALLLFFIQISQLVVTLKCQQQPEDCLSLRALL